MPCSLGKDTFRFIQSHSTRYKFDKGAGKVMTIVRVGREIGWRGKREEHLMRRSATRNFLHSGNFASRVVINVVEHISSLPAVMAVRSRTHTFSPAGILRHGGRGGRFAFRREC